MNVDVAQPKDEKKKRETIVTQGASPRSAMEMIKALSFEPSATFSPKLVDPKSWSSPRNQDSASEKATASDKPRNRGKFWFLRGNPAESSNTEGSANENESSRANKDPQNKEQVVTASDSMKTEGDSAEEDEDENGEDGETGDSPNQVQVLPRIRQHYSSLQERYLINEKLSKTQTSLSRVWQGTRKTIGDAAVHVIAAVEDRGAGAEGGKAANVGEEGNDTSTLTKNDTPSSDHKTTPGEKSTTTSPVTDEKEPNDGAGETDKCISSEASAAESTARMERRRQLVAGVSRRATNLGTGLLSRANFAREKIVDATSHVAQDLEGRDWDGMFQNVRQQVASVRAGNNGEGVRFQNLWQRNQNGVAAAQQVAPDEDDIWGMNPESAGRQSTAGHGVSVPS